MDPKSSSNAPRSGLQNKREQKTKKQKGGSFVPPPLSQASGCDRGVLKRSEEERRRSERSEEKRVGKRRSEEARGGATRNEKVQGGATRSEEEVRGGARRSKEVQSEGEQLACVKKNIYLGIQDKLD